MKTHTFPLRKTLLPLLLAALLPTACRKSCTCLAFNGTEHVYSADEVDANGGSCSDMKYMFTPGSSGADVRYYTYCSWD